MSNGFGLQVYISYYSKKKQKKNKGGAEKFYISTTYLNA